MTKVTGSATINAPVEEVFEFARDTGKLWSKWPRVVVRDVHIEPEGVGSNAHWATPVLGVPVLQGRIEFTEVVPGERIRAKSSTGPLFEFTFTPLPDGATRFAVECDYHFGVPLVGEQLDAALARMVEDDMAGWATAVKAEVEGTAPPVKAEPATLTRSVTIDAPIEQVFDDVLDIGTFWTGAPDVAVREVRMTPEGVGTTARLYSHIGPIHMEGTLEVTEAVPNERIAMKVHFGFESPLWTFTFSPVDGGTMLTGEGEWHMNVPAVGTRLATMEATSHVEILEEMLASAKKRVEEAALVG